MASRTPAPLVPEPEWGTGGLVCPQGRAASCGVGAVPERGPGWFVCTWAMRRCLPLNGPSRFSSLSQRCSSLGSRRAGGSGSEIHLSVGKEGVAVLCGNPFGGSGAWRWETPALSLRPHADLLHSYPPPVPTLASAMPPPLHPLSPPQFSKTRHGPAGTSAGH